MKKYILPIILLFASLLAGAQGSENLSSGFKFSIGVGGKYMTDSRALDVSPELGFHYRANDKNMFGAGLAIDCIYKRENLFLSFTHDFLSKPASPYVEARLGANNFFEKSIGGYLSVQGGYRFSLGGIIPFRIGLTADIYQVESVRVESGRACIIAVGLVLRSEF